MYRLMKIKSRYSSWKCRVNYSLILPNLSLSFLLSRAKSEKNELYIFLMYTVIGNMMVERKVFPRYQILKRIDYTNRFFLGRFYQKYSHVVMSALISIFHKS